MTFGNMDHISKAIAAATAQWRGPGAHLADALRVMQDSLRPQFNAMAAVSEALARLRRTPNARCFLP